MTEFQRFDGYEISRVVEFEDDSCEVVSTREELTAAILSDNYKRDFWSLYGRLPEGGVMVIGDFGMEKDAREVLARIGGTLHEEGV